MNSKIIYSDPYLAVVDKPPGMILYLYNKLTKSCTLVDDLNEKFSNLSNLHGDFRAGIVNRLDKGTSGLILIAKTNEVHMELERCLKIHAIKKSYLAITYKCPNPVLGTISTALAPIKHNPMKMCVLKEKNEDMLSITKYRVLKSYENKQFALVECILVTGRRHQIRVHLHHKKTPIIGDCKYGGYYNINERTISNPKIIPMIKNMDRHALHSHKLEFLHPITKKTMILKSPLEKGLMKILKLMSADFS